MLALIRAKELLEKGWCQGAYARDAEGNSVSCYSSAACIRGALHRATSGMGTEVWLAALAALGRECVCLAEFNDTHTQAEVVALFERVLNVSGTSGGT